MTHRPVHDPYDAMSDRDFDEHVASLFEGSPERTVPVSIRWPEHLLARIKRVAEASGVPYQTLIKNLVSAALPIAEKRQVSAPGRRKSGAAKVATAAKKVTTRPRTAASAPVRTRRSGG
jgi:predicted DNA binding CopG/RHH family protein